MEAACRKADTTFVMIESDSTTAIVEGSSANVVTYNHDLNRYTLNTATPPLPTISDAGDPLIAINWNSNSWDFHKSQKIAELANTAGADAILITDTRIDQWRVKEAVTVFARTLQRATGKVWDGEASPKHAVHRMGGNLIMFSNRISKPKIKHILPLGVLSCLEGSWNKTDFSKTQETSFSGEQEGISTAPQ
jgi:hypothetical protein